MKGGGWMDGREGEGEDATRHEKNEKGMGC